MAARGVGNKARSQGTQLCQLEEQETRRGARALRPRGSARLPGQAVGRGGGVGLPGGAQVLFCLEFCRDSFIQGNICLLRVALAEPEELGPPLAFLGGGTLGGGLGGEEGGRAGG